MNLFVHFRFRVIPTVQIFWIFGVGKLPREKSSVPKKLGVVTSRTVAWDLKNQNFHFDCFAKRHSKWKEKSAKLFVWYFQCVAFDLLRW